MKTRLFWVNLKILFIFILAKYLNISAKDCCDCCDDCLKPKKNIKTTNENTSEQNDDFIGPYYDLNEINTLEEINLNQDLEKIFIQLLSEKLYNVFDVSSLTVFNAKLWGIRKKNEKLNQKVLSYEENTRKQLENFFNEKYIITKDKFENISDDFIKILATFFLKKEDYDEYLKKCVDEGKDKNIQNDNNKEDISNLLNEDESFRDALNVYISNNSNFLNKFEDAKEKLKSLSEKLQSCSPYKEKTYRGTKIYNKKQQALKLDENNKEENYKIIKTFLEKIRSTTWSDRPDGWLTSFSSDPLVAGYFALKHQNINFFPKSPLFRIVIRNNINKTGVYLYENWDPNNTKFTKGIPKEREVLYPQGSKFKILGVRLEILKTYPPIDIPNLYKIKYKKIINGKEMWVKSLKDEEEEAKAETKEFLIKENQRTAESFSCPFIVLDVVEE